MKNKLNESEIRGRTALLLTGTSESYMQILKAFITMMEERGYERSDLVIFSPKENVSFLRKFSNEYSLKIAEFKESKDDSEELFEGQRDFGSSFLISENSFDPLFGFSGGPVSFARIIKKDGVGDAFYSDYSSLPRPGVNTSATGAVNDMFSQYSDITSIEFISTNNVVSNVLMGPLFETHTRSSELLSQSSVISVEEKAKGVIASPGLSHTRSTLSTSLSTLWNSFAALRDRGTIVVLAESSDGFGSDAMRLFSLGKLDLKEEIRKKRYTPGLEDLVFLKNLGEKYSVLFISSLPNYYIEKTFGFSTARKVSDALRQLLGTHGQRTKSYVIPAASEVLLDT